MEMPDCLGRLKPGAGDQVEGVPPLLGVVGRSHEDDAGPEWRGRGVGHVLARDEDPMPGNDRIQGNEVGHKAVSLVALRRRDLPFEDLTKYAAQDKASSRWR